MPVFRTTSGKVTQLGPAPFSNERELQRFVEANLDELLGVRFVATELSTGERHGGRIDTLGLDETGNPVIVEYKCEQKALGSADISWQEPRLILIASSYTKYDGWAVNRLPDNVELLRYQRYSDGTFVLESVNEPLSAKKKPAVAKPRPEDVDVVEYTLDYHREKTTEKPWLAFLDLRDRLVALDGVEERVNQKSQITYRTTKSFAACLFRKNNVLCQFKGGEHVDDPAHRVKDIRSYQWGYPWAFELVDSDSVDYAFKLLKDAYDREQ